MRRGAWAGWLLAGSLTACSTGADTSTTTAWDPNDPNAESGGEDGADGADGADGDHDGGDGADDGGDTGSVDEPCEPGEADACLCPDGLHLGDRVCSEDGVWGACEGCEEGDTGNVDDGDGSDGDPPGDDAGESDDGGTELPEEVCYPGADGSYTTCFPLHYFDPGSFPAGYDYPGILDGDQNYRDPVAFIDLEELSPSTALSPNFVLSEIAEAVKGRWAIVQPHAVESLQALRDAVGAINVNSGYRSPDYNAGVGGVTWSRHIYGDGFDLDPVSVSIDTLEGACTNEGGMLVEYSTHVHCDFRFDAVDEEFFGPEPMAVVVGPAPTLAAELIEEDGTWTASTTGFDEGEPRIRWKAFDAGGELVATGVGPTFTPPPEAVEIATRVGRVIDLAADL